MSLKILIATSISEERKALKELLLGDRKILTAASSAAVFTQLEREAESLDAVLLAYSMPKQSGVEILKRIRLRKEFDPIAVLMLCQSDAEADEAISAGADEVVSPAQSPEDISSALHRAVLRRAAVKPGNDPSDWRESEQLQAIMAGINGGVTAVVVENNRVRFLYRNDEYLRQLGYTKEQFNSEVTDVFALVHPDDRAAVIRETKKASRDHLPFTTTYRIIRRDQSIRYIRSNVSIIHLAAAGDLPVQLSVANDITEQVEAAEGEKRLSEQLQTLMERADLGITATIGIGSEVKYLLANNKFYDMLGYTREQFRAEVIDPTLIIEESERARVLELTKLVMRTGVPQVVSFRALRRDQSTAWFSLAASRGRFTGVSEEVLISIFRDITREKAAEQTERRSAAQLRTLMDDMPGGFVRLRVMKDKSLRPVYFNNGMTRLLGISRRELWEQYGEDIYFGVHPDDLAAIEAVYFAMQEQGAAQSRRYRLKKGSGEYIWVRIFGRATTDELGDTYLNIYYTDATEQVREEEKQKELLDNLPYGAALYSYDGKELSVIHRNKRYWELVGIVPNVNTDSAAPMHGEDQAMLAEKIGSGGQNRDLVCDVRLCCGDGQFRPFHFVGRIVQSEFGALSIYASFTPISVQEMSIRELVPFVLSAVMESSSDLAFAKDKDFKYICASRAFAKMLGIDNEREIIGKTDFDIYPHDYAKKFRADDIALLQEHKSIIDMVEPIPAPDGKTHFSSTSKYLLRDTDGNIIGLYGLGRDITESLQTDSQLKLLTDSIPGGLLSFEVLSETKLKLIYFNEGISALFGMSSEEFAERNKANSMLELFFDEDRDKLKQAILSMLEHDTPATLSLRILVGDRYRWINAHCAPVRRGSSTFIYVALFDVTEQEEALERLRLSEEEYRLAVQHSKTVVSRYDVEQQTLRLPPGISPLYNAPEIAQDVPEGQIRAGLISPNTQETYLAFYESIKSGCPSGEMIYQRKTRDGWRYIQAHFSNIFSKENKPVTAVISFADVTERLEKEAVYKKWQQSLLELSPEAYTLFRSNISKNTPFDSVTGQLMHVSHLDHLQSYDEQIVEYAKQMIVPEDQPLYISRLNSDALLAHYYRGRRTDKFEYRELTGELGYRWLRCSVELVEYLNSSDIEAFLMYEDIDEEKRRLQHTMQLAQTDPLTGLLNRAAFEDRVNAVLREEQNSFHALLMLDIDGFKQVNEAFGHAFGDQTLKSLAADMSALLREDDLCCRLSGDEFLLFMHDIPNEAAAAEMAVRLVGLSRREFSLKVQISGSVGIAVCPKDGRDFEPLYRKADAAIYSVKTSGKNNYLFYRGDTASGLDFNLAEKEPRKRREKMLIVDDSELDRSLLKHLFSDEYDIETAASGEQALISLHKNGSSIGIVLLDLMMPEIDGFTVLEKMQESVELAGIPVIVVSGEDERETCLRAVSLGASDFITKPVDADMLLLRAKAAINKSQKLHQRAHNRYLDKQNDSLTLTLAAIDGAGIAVAQFDPKSEIFIYSDRLSAALCGNFDSRMLWDILRDDQSAEAELTEQLRKLVVGEARQNSAGITAKLQTPSGHYHRFRINARSAGSQRSANDKIIVTFVDLGE